MPVPRPIQLTVSIVVYSLNEAILLGVLRDLRTAINSARQAGELSNANMTLVDNGQQQGALEALATTVFADQPVEIVSGHGNIGYGRAHNLIINTDEPASPEDCYLILNPDVYLHADALTVGLKHLRKHPASVAVTPSIMDDAGHRQSGCKRYPSVLDFVLRGFAPAPVKRRFSQRLRQYEMLDLPHDEPSDNIPIISGCFMLFRHAQLKQLQGFDPGYFLYFEDFDLAIRARALGTLTYLPTMQIRHLGGHSARKGWRHIGMFIWSALQFYKVHGWRWS